MGSLFPQGFLLVGVLEDRFCVGGVNLFFRACNVGAGALVDISDQLLLVTVLERRLRIRGVDPAVAVRVADRTDLSADLVVCVW